MKVLLVSANRLTVPFPVYPLGLDHVAGSLDGRHEVRVLDLCAAAAGDLERTLLEMRPEVVGISVRNIDNTDVTDPRSFVEELRALVARVRAASSGPVVLGGAGFSIFPQELLDLAGADYGIAGEGERVAELLDAIEQGRAATLALPNLVRRGASGFRLQAPLGARPIRRPPVAGAALDLYLRQGGMLNLQTKRGCPYHCVYCTYPVIEGRRLTLFDPGQVGREARQLEQAGARFLWITDSVFNAHPEHSLAVARALKQAGLGIPWGGFFAPFAPPEGYYRELAACGLSHVELGTESLSDPVLAAYGKSFGADDVFVAHRAARDAGLHVAHYFMLGGPGETRETLGETLARAEDLSGAVLFFFCGLRIYPGTPLRERAEREGQIAADASLLEPTYYQPRGLTLEEIPRLVSAQARGRTHWVVGSGGDDVSRVVERLHRRGRVGPLWEKMLPP